jgi:tetratricopeptide (TPR) repeat protein
MASVSPTSRLFAAAGILSALVFAAQPAFAQKKEADLPDTIILTDGGKRKAEVVREDPKQVVFKNAQGKEQKLDNEQVTRIDFKDFPGELGAAEAALERREFSKAESSADEAFKSCADERSKTLFGSRALVARARAMRGMNRFSEASQIAQQAIDEAKGSKWTADAYIERVAALAASGSEECQTVGNEAEGKGDTFGEEFTYDIKLIVGDFWVNKKSDASKAKEKLAFVKNSKRQGMQDRADLLLARCKLLEKNWKGAEEAFDKIARTSQDPDALAGAALGLGDLKLTAAKDGGAKGLPDGLRAALVAYLRGAVLAQPAGGSTGENHEKALKGAAEAARAIVDTIPVNKNAKDIGARKFFCDYSRKLYEDLIKTYPSSTGADDVRKQIADLRKKSGDLEAELKPSEGK